MMSKYSGKPYTNEVFREKIETVALTHYLDVLDSESILWFTTYREIYLSEPSSFTCIGIISLFPLSVTLK
jgi:hypothetical protein